jgi:hypothetical protein
MHSVKDYFDILILMNKAATVGKRWVYNWNLFGSGMGRLRGGRLISQIERCDDTDAYLKIRDCLQGTG